MKNTEPFWHSRRLYWVDALLIILFLGMVGYAVAVRYIGFLNPSGVEYVEANYGADINDVAETYGYQASFLKALCMLESGGRKHIKPRFEKHIYNALKHLRDRGTGTYETITAEQLSNASDEALKNLASSWGPFQLMGYKCLQLGIQVKDLRGPRSVHWAMKWIDINYGYLLKAGRYDDAFHVHNTGQVMRGRSHTHDPNYIRNGFKYMKEFDGKRK